MSAHMQRSIRLHALFLFLSLLLTVAGNAITIMPMGDSITVGVDYLTNTSGGYRDPLYHSLTAAGFSFTFVGAANSDATPALTAAGQTYHNGYGGWHIKDLNNNLDGVAAPISGGDSNLGGYFITGGHGTGRPAVYPDILLLHAGTNDILQNNQSINQDLLALVTHFHTLSPNTIILIAGIIPINNTGFVPIVQAYNSYIKNTLVPSLPYTRYVDQNTNFLNANGTVDGELLGSDFVHPDRYGYPIVANTWETSLEAYEANLGTTPVSPVTPSTTNPTVSVQFVGGGAAPLVLQTANYTAGAGTFNQSHWNPVLQTGNTISPISQTLSSGLTDATGASTTLGYTLQASGAYYTGAGRGFTSSPAYPGYPGELSGPGDAFLFAGFVYAGYSNSKPITLTVTGLKTGELYDLVVYVTPFEGFGNSQTATAALTGGATYYLETDGSAGSYERVTSTAPTSPSKGNYVEFDGLTGSSSQTVTFTNTSSMVGVSGFQIIDVGPS